MHNNCQTFTVYIGRIISKTMFFVSRSGFDIALLQNLFYNENNMGENALYLISGIPAPYMMP